MAPTQPSSSGSSEAGAARSRRFRYILAAALVALAVAGALAAYALWARPAPPGARQIEVTIPRGATLAAAAKELHAAGVVRHPRLFALSARLLGGPAPIRYGTYKIPEGEGFVRILAQLHEGRVEQLRITIPEGLPSVMVAERLAATPRLTGPVAVPAEGSVLPDTYLADIGESRMAVLRRMQAAMTETSARLWAARSPDAPVQTLADAITLASIVEKESGMAQERRRVAGLYANRLKAGMRLQADPTVIYPVTKGKPLGRRILQSELAADNGYNTYVRAGLPKGPITNPGRASLEAVLHPEANDFLYMVASGDGGHVFARSYAEHQKNVARWRAFRAERGV